MQYGIAEFVDVLKSLQKRLHKLPYKSDSEWNLMVTCGGQDALTQALNTFIDDYDYMLIEAPTYRLDHLTKVYY